MTELKRNNKGHFAPGTAKIGGRLRGTPNKSTLEIKQAVELVFEDMGGTDALLKWAQENQTTFYTQIWVKLLPASLKVEANVSDFAPILERARQRVTEKVTTELVDIGG